MAWGWNLSPTILPRCRVSEAYRLSERPWQLLFQVNTPKPLLINLSSTEALGQRASVSPGHWWVVHSKATIHPFSSHSVSLSTSIHHHLAYLNPFFQLFQSLFPHLLSPEKDRLRVTMVLMWCCRGRAEVIEELLIRCGGDVMSHHVFY